MIKLNTFFKAACIAVVIAVASPAHGQDLAKQANAFLNSLTGELKSKAQFAFGDAERFNWNFVPLERKGPTFRDFNEKQKAAALALLRASLSDQGFQKATNIMAMDDILKAIENRPDADHYRDPLNYHFCIFGEPSSVKEWGWRFEGHHISMNFSSTKGAIISGTPFFFGSNPGIVSSGEKKGYQILKEEMDLGYSLVKSLDEKQLKVALISEKAPSEIITGNKRKASLLEPHGVHFSELTADQRRTFLQLLDVYINNYPSKFSAKFLDKIKKAGIDNLHFAWAGSTERGSGHYYRIQGPVLLIEYDDTQNNANHIHTVVRDLTSDFGEDVLAEHYQQEHHN
ncbi:MAG TPA: hypothetical protein DIT07_04615 [Sphingobacteriaceae bacterium]|nr:hypothetical protein [Sphingobacteriaceae bacterium]